MGVNAVAVEIKRQNTALINQDTICDFGPELTKGLVTICVCRNWLALSFAENDTFSMKSVVNAVAFYANYHGHVLSELEKVVASLRTQKKKVIWLVGDSSLDNKHWLYTGYYKERADPSDNSYWGDACNGFEEILEPARSVKDVAWWLNRACADNEALAGYAAVNAAVEESTAADREGGNLLAHDEFVRDSLQEGDIVIVSVGGNDIALRPTKSVMVSMGMLYMTPQFLLRWGFGFGKG